MHNIKYFSKKQLAFYMGELLSETAPEQLFKDIDLIIPIPLHWLRKQKRGYNQAEWFARGIASKIPHITLFTTGIVRKKRTKTQVKLHREDRAKNVRNVFQIKETAASFIRGKAVMLVDDVITTGATTGSCTTTLLNAGCSLVKVLSLARD
ncbi:MAG: ComF family protein [Fibrobacter sp.]|nr:ComF family protein [Fibrobacter sp.]